MDFFVFASICVSEGGEGHQQGEVMSDIDRQQLGNSGERHRRLVAPFIDPAMLQLKRRQPPLRISGKSSRPVLKADPAYGRWQPEPLEASVQGPATCPTPHQALALHRFTNTVNSYPETFPKNNPKTGNVTRCYCARISNFTLLFTFCHAVAVQNPTPSSHPGCRQGPKDDEGVSTTPLPPLLTQGSSPTPDGDWMNLSRQGSGGPNIIGGGRSNSLQYRWGERLQQVHTRTHMVLCG